MEKFEKEIAAILICNALEGGSNYWYYIDAHNFKEIDGIVYLSAILSHEKGFLVISDSSGHNYFEPVKITYKDVEIAWQKFSYEKKYRHHFYDAIRENDDACTGDVFFQLVVMKEVPFG